MKRYRHILLLTLLPLLLIGCKEHKQIDGLQPATVELSIPVSTQRGGFLLVEDVPVQTLRILVFNKKGGVLDAQKRFEQPTSDLSDWLRVEAHEGEKIVYVIANEASGMTAQLDGILFESDLKGLPITDVDPVNDRKLLMVGSGAATLSKSSTTQIIVRLVPAKAKI